MNGSPAETATSRSAAMEILVRVERSGAWASILLDRAESRMPDERDAALMHELVLGVIRQRAILDRAISSVADRPVDQLDADVRAALRLGVYSLLFLDRVPDFAAVDTAVELVAARGSRGRRGFVNGVLRSVNRRGRDLLPPRPAPGDLAGLALHRSFPVWWVARLVRRLGWEAADELLQACNAPARTVLRPNRSRVDPQRLAARLEREGIRTEPGTFLPEALRVVSGRPRRSKVLEEGLAWVQDEGAQLAGRLIGRACGPLAADLCAAPGGKTMQIAEALVEGGVVVAVDRHAGRLRRMRANLLRSFPGTTLPVLADASAERLPLRRGFHHVLVDAPCSGTGTLRRHPEIRWRLREEDLKLLAARQRRMLEAAAWLLEPGGSVVYSVCSLEPEEGEDVIEGFLADHAEFEAVDPRSTLPAPAHGLVRGPGFLHTAPTVGELDGFFAARLMRSSTAR